MDASPRVPIIDGHNDALLRLCRSGGSLEPFLEGSGEGHLDLPRAQQGGLAGGFFALFVPSTWPHPQTFDVSVTGDGYEARLSDPIDHGRAQSAAIAMMAPLYRLERESAGRLTVARTVDDLARCIQTGTLGAILHLEGAEPIDPELDALEVFYQAGLRSLGLVWSRPNAFGHGVPFAFPRSPDTGPGLTDAGRDLVRACNRLGIMLDLSHLNERGFWDMARLSEAPLVATHSNAHALCPVTRNLTDAQLNAIRESDGMVGVAFDVSMLRADGSRDPDTGLGDIVRHIDYLVGRLGIDGVGFGSDFDGTTVPRELGDVAGLPRLLATLREHGYDETSIRKLAHENWLRVLEKTWKA